MMSRATAGAVVYRRDEGIDAIDEYSRQLVRAIRRLGVEVSYFPDGMRELFGSRAQPSWVLLEYNPFRYGRWGFAPRLLLDVWRLRRGRIRVAVMVHEAWLDISDWRTGLMGGWQRIQLQALVRQVDAVMTSTEAIARMLGPAAIHLPVASNITPADVAPEVARARLGIERRTVVSLFGRSHPSRALEYAEAAIAAIAEAQGADTLTVLNVGADAPAVRTPDGVEVVDCGPQPSVEVSLRLRASDLVLLPFSDGVSTRRSTLMAALAHRRPVLGLRGKNTDRILIDAPDALALTPVGDVDAFARAAARLTQAPQLMQSIGEEGARLYERRFDWPVTAARLASVLERLDSGRSGLG